jgi:GNAT superfamily N-acetyltransferase
LTRVVVRRIGPDEWQALREVRLAALADAPYAYLTTLVEAQAQPAGMWQDRIAANPHFLATVGGVAVGMMVVIAADSGREIVAVWVAPEARGRGVIEALFDAAVRWAGDQGDAQLGLWVVEGNERAERAYARYGFSRTGRSQPVPGRPEEIEVEMTYAL